MINLNVDAALSNCFIVEFDSNNIQLQNPTNLTDGMVLNFVFKQDVTVARTLTFGTKYKFPGGTVPALTTSLGAIDFMSCYYYAADDILICVMNRDFR
jgi:hypothetical protein